MSFSYISDKNKPLPRVSIDEILADEKSAVDIKPGWRPWTISTTILLSAMFFTAGLVVLIGLLQWQQFRNGALFAVSTTDNFSNMQNFLNRYLPTIVIVLYGMGWSWIDLDVKRLEPWYQLARPEGASAEQSLLLHYPLDFLPFVPFKSAKRKQWSVVSASTIMVIVVWALTPLQNGIFSNTLLTRRNEVAVHGSKALLSVPQQASALGVNILNRAYSSLWLGQALPPFTTADFALTPFDIAAAASSTGSNQTLASNTNMYGVEVDCKPPAKVSIDNSTGVTFDDGQGCVAQDLISYTTTEFSEQFISYFIGYYDDPHADSSLQIVGCPASAARTSLVIWKRASTSPPNFKDPSNATALFCSASYYVQSVSATVLLPERTILDIVPTGPKNTITNDIFNITQFEYVLVNGAPPGVALGFSPEVPKIRLDVVDTTILHQDTQVTNMSLVVPVPNMIAFAIGATHLEPDAYLDPDTLANAIQKAWSLTFAVAIAAVVEQPVTRPIASGIVEATFQAVTLVPAFSILSQFFLLIVLVFTCVLLTLTQRRPSKLARDPDSLAQIMCLANDARLRRMFNQLDSADDKQLAEALMPFEFDLSRNRESGEPTIQYSTQGAEPFINQKIPPITFGRENTGTETYTKPFEYSAATQISITVYLAGLIFGLVFLRQKGLQENGLPLPSNSTIVQQMLINFIPTSISTLLEPFFVLICRLACLLRPLEELRSGNALARTTLLTRYTSVPPQLVLWRALQDRRFVLACLCLLALLANVLTVALSGLLNINEVAHSTSASLRPLYTPNFSFSSGNNITGFETRLLNQYNLNDAFYIADINFTDSTPLPIWTTPSYYFLPMDLPLGDYDAQPSHEWNVRALGHGADLDCQELTQTPSEASYELEFGLNASFVKILATYTRADGTKFQCKPSSSTGNATGGDTTFNGAEYSQLFGDSTGRKAFEVSTSMTSLNGFGGIESTDPCNPLFVRGWARVEDGSVPEATVSQQINGKFPQPDGVKSTFISCKQRTKSALFDTTVSSSGSILAAQRISADKYNPSGSPLEFAASKTAEELNGAQIPIWHDDTISNDWLNYLIKQQTRSVDFLNATLPPPSFEMASNATSELFSRLFAIQMSLLSSQLSQAEAGAPPLPATLLTAERRIFMSENLFRISLAVLCFDLLVVVVFYWGLPKPFLPRLPTSIASQVAFFAGSHVIDDVQRAGGDLRELDAQGYRYGYGKYIGQDGWAHVGIERVPYVVKFEDRKGSTANFFRRWRRKK